MSITLIDIKEQRDADGAISMAVRERIFQALQGIRFGAVEIIIHDGKVVQIERKERLRFEK